MHDKVKSISYFKHKRNKNVINITRFLSAVFLELFHNT